MTNEANDIVKQAKNGSVAAIIQVLNEKLTDSGVRTRAIFEGNVLQLLCEGQTLDQLEQPILVERIRYLLEEISPRNVRRVNINSRIVREQQLLWLEEINRDRENQLLWSEEITLKKPNFFKQLVDDWSTRDATPKAEPAKASSAKNTSQKQREKRQFWRGLTGGVLASCLLLLAGWWVYTRYGAENAIIPASMTSGEAERSPSTATNLTTPPQPQNAVTTADPFAEAVRLAERTSQSSQTAKSAAEWLNLAAQWQKASDLMAQVAVTDARYKTAQGRVVDYRKNSEIALQKARQVQAAGASAL
ncbi:hypothetical protein OsccyDRAFT_4239 [Leptolyngbyaceae cyanobacterium JSC-12]|nr:hypothetical protein OsccyDRAFT_4239 [Leptolyngbyaceae cyanobacterium JSC-12]